MSAIEPQPLFIVGLSSVADQAVAQGVQDHLQRHALDWPVVVAGQPGMAQRLNQALRLGRGNGRPVLVGHISSPALVQRAVHEGLIVISWRRLSGWEDRIGRVLPDAELIGRTAAEYLRAAGWSSLRYWPTGNPRETAFARRAAQLGMPAVPICNKAIGWSEGDVIDHLRQLPMRTAIFCSSDTLAVEVGHLCRAGGIAVPDHLALLGSDDKADLCEAQQPALASVRVPWRLVGQRMALLAHRACCGDTWKGVTDTVAPLGVQERASARPAATDDEWTGILATAAARPRPDLIQLAHILGCSPRTAELRFKRHCGLSLRAWHAQRRVQLALDLLLNTGLSVGEVAQRTGYGSLQGLGEALRNTVGLGPRSLRRECRR